MKKHNLNEGTEFNNPEQNKEVFLQRKSVGFAQSGKEPKSDKGRKPGR